ncbi:MAG: hypothetical protein MJ221_00185 [Bacilli bacterium]|nr:hypothetical protein [Bacilli bacterium]
MKVELTKTQCDKIFVGEAITLTAIMAICAVAIVAVVVYKLFLSKSGETSIPGGWKFSWK